MPRKKTPSADPYAGLETIDDVENAYFSDAAGWTCRNEKELSGYNDVRKGNEDGRGPQCIQRLYEHRKSKKKVILHETTYRGEAPGFSVFKQVDLDEI